ncbi:hypothetical protein ABPG75_013505 [Micractinium tetrahymenae]
MTRNLPTAKLLRCLPASPRLFGTPVCAPAAAQTSLLSQQQRSSWRRQWRQWRHRLEPQGAAQAAAAAAASNGSGSSAKSVLFISSVWPERSSSAAGVRTSDLLASFQRRGWAATYACSSAPNEHAAALAAAGVATHGVPPNREAALAEALAAAAPAAVVFDRFYNEEAFSFCVRELAPHALRVLDMQDFHALRACRQRLAEAGAPPAEVLAARPDAHAPECLRELAAIHRSDLTLVCSPVEVDMLTRHYGVPASKLVLAPFFAPPSPHARTATGEGAPAAAAAAALGVGSTEAAGPGGAGGTVACPPFHERRHFVMIGNWRHPPNLDSARWACSELWPALCAALPPGEREGVELHLYGAYAVGAAQQLHRPKEGVRMLGFAPSLDIMLQYRVLLAPLRYGAGLKGKVVDAWWHGLPVITTPIGAEGMTTAVAGPADLAAAGAAAAAGTAAAAAMADPACEGYIWQLGDSSGSGNGDDAAGAAQGEWGGLCGADTPAGLAAAAALLYSDQHLWSSCQQRGFQLLGLLYDGERNLGRVHAAIEAAAAELEARRAVDFTGAMLWSQQLRATEYFSRWIELKEGLKERQQPQAAGQQAAAGQQQQKQPAE